MHGGKPFAGAQAAHACLLLAPCVPAGAFGMSGRLPVPARQRGPACAACNTVCPPARLPVWQRFLSTHRRPCVLLLPACL